MLERTDYKIDAPHNATVGSPIKIKVEVPTNRGNEQGTFFEFTDGAGGKFKPKRAHLEEGKGEFTVTYTPKKQGNLVVSIWSTDDAQAPCYRTIRCTLMQVTGEIVRGEAYSIGLYNPQALYQRADEGPYTTDVGTITFQHVINKNSVEIYGDAPDEGDEIVFTDTLTDGVHTIRVPIAEKNESKAKPLPIGQSLEVSDIDLATYDPQGNATADDLRPRVKPDDSAPFNHATEETTPKSVNEEVIAGQDASVDDEHIETGEADSSLPGDGSPV